MKSVKASTNDRFLAVAQKVFVADKKEVLVSSLLTSSDCQFIDNVINTNSARIGKEIWAAKERKQYNGHVRSLFVLFLLEMYLEEILE